MTKARTLADNFAADINGITAGTGITGGGTSGTVTVTNSMATAIDAKGDLVVGTGADTFSRLAVASTAGYLLSVDSAETTGLKWAAPASGAMTLIQRTSFTDVANTGTTFDSIFTSTYRAYQVVIEKIHSVAGATADQPPQLELYYSGTLQTATYYGQLIYSDSAGLAQSNTALFTMSNQIGYDVLYNSYVLWFNNVGNTSEKASWYGMGWRGNTGGGVFLLGGQQTNRTYTGFRLKAGSGNITGTVAIYGLAVS